MIKGRNTEDLGGGKHHPPADVIQSTRGKPAKAGLHGVQDRKEEVTFDAPVS
jgi:hypothetical protein